MRRRRWRMSQNNRLLFPNTGWSPNGKWLICDEFTDTLAAGGVNGTAATPGPGTRAGVDASSIISVSSGGLLISGTPAAVSSIAYAQQTRAAGQAVIVKPQILTTPNAIRAGWLLAPTNGAASPGHMIDVSTGSAYNIRNGYAIISGIATSFDVFASVLRASGALFLIKLGGTWTLQWVDAATTSNMYPGILAINTSAHVVSFDYLRAIALPAPFDTDDGLATDTKSGSVAAGTTFVHESDFVLEFTVDTLPSTATGIRVMVRKQGTNDYWLVYVNQTGGFYLYEYPSGTSRASAAGVISPGDRIVVIAEGTTIKGYSANTLRWSYASATAFATSTNGLLEALTGGAVSDLKTWPRTLSGTAASILNKVSA